MGVGGRAARRGGVSRCKGTPLCVACRAALPLRGGGRVARRGGGAWRGGSGRWALARRWRGGFGSPPPRALSGRAPSVLRGGAARGRCAAAALPPAALGRGGTIGGSGVLLASHPPCSPLTPFARGRRAAWRRRALRRGGRSAVGAGSRTAPPPRLGCCSTAPMRRGVRVLPRGRSMARRAVAARRGCKRCLFGVYSEGSITRAVPGTSSAGTAART